MLTSPRLEVRYGGAADGNTRQLPGPGELLDPVWRHTQALNVPSLVRLLGDLDALGEASGMSGNLVIHDEIAQFGPSIKTVFELMKNARRLDIPWPNGRVTRLGYSALGTLMLVSSVRVPMIQAADILAGALYTFSRKSNSNEVIEDEMLAVCSPIMCSLFLHHPNACAISAADDVLGRVMKPAVAYMERFATSD